ncbi:uncharacterized protein [Nicotiana tomentosiformis]|uniref:uncharacterized protein n=1 Tax=Nicotiana tomentosiformis TaxID=4098 RepID=UPI00388CCC93
MADRMKRPLDVIEDVLVRIDKFILPADFVILDCEVDYEVPIIFGRPFLATDKALCDVEAGELTFRIGDEQLVFHVCKPMRHPNSNEVCSFVDLVTDVIIDDTSDTINVGDMLEAILLNFDDDEMDGFIEYVDSTLAVLQKRKKAGWTLADIRGIRPAFCTHEIKLEDGAIISIEHQIRLNEAMQEVFKKEIIKWLDVGVVYPISDSSWISPYWLDVKRPTWVFNWEKCYFMIEEGIVLVHKFLRNGIEVDKAEIEVISKISSPTSVKGVRSFLGHAGFYRRFIKDFSKVLKLTTTPIITAPNWSLPFELICDASDVVVWAILGQHINKVFYPVYYASKIMNISQANYTIMEKELISIVFAIKMFHPYLMGAKVSVHTNLAALCYLMRKKLIRRCVSEEEQGDIIGACHSSSYGGHHGGARTTAKVLSCGFYWPTLYKDASDLVKRCAECQWASEISKKNEMPLTTILEIDIFNIWGIEFMGPFTMFRSRGYGKTAKGRGESSRG